MQNKSEVNELTPPPSYILPLLWRGRSKEGEAPLVFSLFLWERKEISN